MPMLVFNGYYHHFNGSRTATIKENSDKQWQAYAGRTQHNHEPNAIQASFRTFQHELRSEALNGAKATREIVKVTEIVTEIGMPSWTVHNPSMQTGTAHSMEQELAYPSVAFQIEANHCDVVLDVEPPL
ncbi:hypothetical protein DdX_10906 [Ditylenchus destructor]|uniref:Uncharacterized protein n=1 Tax=Ditylenchus destructor TaxID=166010 RepID=A0AAD4N013_9BILA|nr:hypothetical protein DdX_10906 [Ditylenchus destructor]